MSSRAFIYHTKQFVGMGFKSDQRQQLGLSVICEVRISVPAGVASKISRWATAGANRDIFPAKYRFDKRKRHRRVSTGTLFTFSLFIF